MDATTDQSAALAGPHRPTLPDAVAAALAELKAALYELYGKRLLGVYLYGSYARGDYDEDSDVDVLVLLEGDVWPGTEIMRMSEAVYPVRSGHELLISLLPASTEQFLQMPDIFFDQVRDEAVRV